MMINEMKMDMAWPEACFQAGTAKDCAEEVRRWMNESSLLRKLTLRDAVEQVCREELTPDFHRDLADLGPLNLFAIVSGE
jgi:hypothetical protein